MKGKAPPPKAPAAKDLKNAPPVKEEIIEEEMSDPLPKTDFCKPLKYDLQPA